jgi:hypothetical protein
MEELAVCAEKYAAFSPVIFGVCFAIIPAFMLLIHPSLKQLAWTAIIGGIGVAIGFFAGGVVKSGVVFLVVATFGLAFVFIC